MISTTYKYTYDGYNRIIRKERSDGYSIVYKRDDLGRIIEKTITRPDPVSCADWDTQPLNVAEIERIARSVSAVEIGSGVR